jgi:prepilin-type N-terminal cleavage/methylation domain-containing protein
MMRRPSPTRRGFTLIELLVVISLIVLLMVLLVVAVSGARTSAYAAKTVARMTAMNQALSRYNDEIGHLPPILDENRQMVEPIPLDKNGALNPNWYREVMNDNAGAQKQYSITSLAEFLLGYGTHAQDGFGHFSGVNAADQTERGGGIRHPGRYGIWGARDLDSGGLNTAGLAARVKGVYFEKAKSGPTYGPYLEVDDAQMLGALGVRRAPDGTVVRDAYGNVQWDHSLDPVTRQPMIYYSGDDGYHPDATKVIVDAWGSPIRYYRTNYPAGAPHLSYGPGNKPFVPTLSDFIALRPWQIQDGAQVDHCFISDEGGVGDMNSSITSPTMGIIGDAATTLALQVGEWALFSPGPDRRLNPTMRVDEFGYNNNSAAQAPPSWSGLTGPSEAYNKDNIVEIGQ